MDFNSKSFELAGDSGVNNSQDGPDILTVRSDTMLDECEGSLQSLDINSAAQNTKEVSPAESTHNRRFVGFVSDVDGRRAMVTSNLTYPGKDTIVVMSDEGELKIGNFLEIVIPDDVFKKYFPWPIVEDTEQFTTSQYKKIRRPNRYVVCRKNNELSARIFDLRLSHNHNEGANINDRYLGCISDPNRLIQNGPIHADIIVNRQEVQISKSGEPTQWKVVKIKTKPEKMVKEEPLVLKLSNGSLEESNLDQMRVIQPTSLPTRNNKRAFVTSIKHIGGEKNNVIASLWLIDEHSESIFKCTANEDLTPGHCFIGAFTKPIGTKWFCEKYVRRLPPLLAFCNQSGTFEVKVIAFRFFADGNGRTYPETYHPLIGKIIDTKKIIPLGGCKYLTIAISYNAVSRMYQWEVVSCRN